jgi:polysaccharide export outer membrane protein
MLCQLFLTALLFTGVSAQQSQQQGQPPPPPVGAQPVGTQPARPASAPPAQASQEAKPPMEDPSRPVVHERYPRYQIKADDIITLAFRYTPEFDQDVTVQPDGYIQLKGLSNDVHAAGLTVPQLIDALKKAYSNTLHDPLISVVLKDFDRPYFVVGGQVGHPGKFDLRGSTSATQAIAIAGGFNDAAKHSQVLLFRRYNDQWMQAKVLDLKNTLKGKNIQEDVELQPGDMLFVPKSKFAKISPFLPRASMGTYFSGAGL